MTVRKWSDATLVDIREYYQIGGEGPYKPGKKGISLSVEQWRALRADSAASPPPSACQRAARSDGVQKFQISDGVRWVNSKVACS